MFSLLTIGKKNVDICYILICYFRFNFTDKGNIKRDTDSTAGLAGTFFLVFLSHGDLS